MTMQCIACEQALHLGDIVKSRRARGDAKAGVAGEKGFPRPLAYSPFARVFSHGSLHSPKKRACSQAMQCMNTITSQNI